MSELRSVLAPDRRIQRIDNYFVELDAFPWVPYQPIGHLIVEEAQAAGIGVPLLSAFSEQESESKNIIGCDHGPSDDNPPYCQHKVTNKRVDLLRASEWMNGIGITQLTWWTYVEDAESWGGAHLPRYQLRRAALYIRELLDEFDYMNALEAYNDGNGRTNDPNNPYDLQVAEKHKAWKKRLL